MSLTIVRHFTGAEGQYTKEDLVVTGTINNNNSFIIQDDNFHSISAYS